jgi:glutamyl-tRNA synthetase
MFDLKKLDSFNAHYLRNRHPDVILENMTSMPGEFLFGLDDIKMDLIAKMAIERVTFAKELKDAMIYLWIAPELSEEIKLKNVDEFVKVMNIFVAEDFMSNFDEKEWTVEHIRMELESISINTGSTVGKIMPMLRLALTGGVPGPQLPEIMYIIGPRETKSRIDVLLNRIKELA